MSNSLLHNRLIIPPYTVEGLNNPNIHLFRSSEEAFRAAEEHNIAAEEVFRLAEEHNIAAEELFGSTVSVVICYEKVFQWIDYQYFGV